MKLAIARQTYTPFGGAERFVAQAIDALRTRQVQVEVVARTWNKEAGGIRCDPFYLGRTWRDWGFSRCVRVVIASGRYDLVQSHERIPGCHIFRAGDGVHATWLELSGKPWRFSPWHRYTLAAEAAMFRHPALRAVICNSQMVAQDIESRWPETADKLAVVYNGVDLERFHPGLRAEYRAAFRAKVGVGGTARVILFVGSGYTRKGAATLIEALAQLPDETEAWIVGRDKDEARYRKLAARLGVASRARFFGAQTDVRPYFGAADLFCLPTLYDPLPNAALEALACGLPVVTTPHCGVAELLTPDFNGALVPATAPSSLWASVLERMLDRATEPDTPASARAAVAAHDYATMAGKLLALYASLGIATAPV